MADYYTHLGQDDKFLLSNIHRTLSNFFFKGQVEFLAPFLLEQIKAQYQAYNNFNENFQPQDCIYLIERIIEDSAQLLNDNNYQQIFREKTRKQFLLVHIEKELQHYTLPVAVPCLEDEFAAKQKIAELVANAILEFAREEEDSLFLQNWSSIALNQFFNNFEYNYSNPNFAAPIVANMEDLEFELENLKNHVEQVGATIRDTNQQIAHLQQVCGNREPLFSYLSDVRRLRETIGEFRQIITELESESSIEQIAASADQIAARNEQIEINTQILTNRQNELQVLTTHIDAQRITQASKELLARFPSAHHDPLFLELGREIKPFLGLDSGNYTQFCPPKMVYSVARARLQAAIVPFSIGNIIQWFKHRKINQDISRLLAENPPLANEQDWCDAYNSVVELKSCDKERASRLAKPYPDTTERVKNLCLTLQNLEKNLNNNVKFQYYYGDTYFHTVRMIKKGRSVPQSIASNEIVLQQNDQDNNFTLYWKEDDSLLSCPLARNALNSVQYLLKAGKSNNQQLIKKIIETKSLSRDDRKGAKAFRKELTSIRFNAEAELDNKKVLIGLCPEVVYANMIKRLEDVLNNIEFYFPSSGRSAKNRARDEALALLRTELSTYKKLVAHEELSLQYASYRDSQKNSREELLNYNWQQGQAESQSRNQLIKGVLPQHQLLFPHKIQSSYKDAYRSSRQAYHAKDNSNMDAERYKDAASYKAVLDIVNDDWRKCHQNEYRSMEPLYVIQAECEPQGNLDSKDKNGRQKSAARFFLTPEEENQVRTKFVRSKSVVVGQSNLQATLEERLTRIKKEVDNLLRDLILDEDDRTGLVQIAELNFADEVKVQVILNSNLENVKSVMDERVFPLFEKTYQLLNDYTKPAKKKSVSWNSKNDAVEIREGNHTVFKSLAAMENDFHEEIEPSSNILSF